MTGKLLDLKPDVVPVDAQVYEAAHAHWKQLGAVRVDRLRVIFCEGDTESYDSRWLGMPGVEERGDRVAQRSRSVGAVSRCLISGSVKRASAVRSFVRPNTLTVVPGFLLRQPRMKMLNIFRRQTDVWYRQNPPQAGMHNVRLRSAPATRF